MKATKLRIWIPDEIKDTWSMSDVEIDRVDLTEYLIDFKGQVFIAEVIE